MKKLAIIGTVVAAVALGLVGQAVAKPTSSVNPLPSAVALEQGQNQRLDASKPAFGMTPAEYNALMARSEGLNKKYGLGTYSRTGNTKAIETNGRNLVASTPTPTPNPTDTSNSFAWDDAGIGAGVLLAVMAFATLGVLGARHHGRLGTS
jgi:H+/gluconate symporter-like permease